MNRAFTVLIALVLGGLLPPMAHGQKQTEQYVPLGSSPGVSGKSSRIGTIDAVNAQAKTLTVQTPEGRFDARVTARTRIWIDRSQQKQSTQTGAFQDLKTGRRVEVKYEDAERRGNAEWIKIE